MKNITKTRQRELLHGNVQKPNLRVQLHHGGESLSSPLIVQSRQLSGKWIASEYASMQQGATYQAAT
jgi:hypothetical protein